MLCGSKPGTSATPTGQLAADTTSWDHSTRHSVLTPDSGANPRTIQSRCPVSRAKAVGAVSQATGQLHGALQGVDAVETMVADVQGGTAVLA